MTPRVLHPERGIRRRRPGLGILRYAVLMLGLFFQRGDGATAASETIEFDIRPGPASAVLRDFAEQSGCQVIFPTNLVGGVTLPGLRGKFPLHAALDRLLARSTLAAREDETTGAFAIIRDPSLAPADVKIPPAIRLPPFVVNEDSNLTWRHAVVPGVEVLSQCPDYVTAALVHQHYALHELLARVLPRSLQARSDVPTTYIFFDGTRHPAVAQELLQSLQSREAILAKAQADATGEPVRVSSVATLPNFRFWDLDSHAVLFVANDEKLSPLMLAPSYVRYLLDHRTPALPPWFVEGMMEVYQRMILNAETVPSANPSAHPPGFSLPFGELKPNAIRIRPLTWNSEKLNGLLVEAAGAGHRDDFEFLLLSHQAQPVPLAEMVSRGPDLNDAAYTRRWRDTAALLIRFALTSGGAPTGVADFDARGDPLAERDNGFRPGVNAENLWRFVLTSAQGNAGEDRFRRDMGFSFADGDTAFRDFLFNNIRSVTTLDPVVIPLHDPVALQDATVAEVARIKGGFNRLEIGYVQELYPALAEKYAGQARRALYRGFDAGVRDQRLLAEIGLFHCDVGDDRSARPFLEAAVGASLIRPRVYYELARIRFAEFHTGDPAAKLTAVQVKSVIAPLERGLRMAPPIADGYELMAETLLRADAPPGVSDFEMMRKGVATFPGRPRLLLSVALLHAASQHWSEATALIERGRKLEMPRSLRARYEKLREAIAANATPPR